MSVFDKNPYKDRQVMEELGVKIFWEKGKFNKRIFDLEEFQSRSRINEIDEKKVNRS